MPISIQALREQKAEKLKAARELQSKETFTVDDQTAFDALLADANALESRIQGQMKLEGLTDPQQAESVAGFTNEGGHVEVAAKPVYRNLGEQLIDVQAMTLDTADAPKARERFMQVVNAASGASTGVDSEGGYLVETDKSKGIMTSAMENGLLARRVTVQPISANSDGFEYLVSDDRNRTTRNGLSVYWKGETTAMASSGKVALKTREMRVKDLYGLLYVTNRMLRDAPALAAFAQRALREEFAFKLDQAIFEGSGAASRDHEFRTAHYRSQGKQPDGNHLQRGQCREDAGPVQGEHGQRRVVHESGRSSAAPHDDRGQPARVHPRWKFCQCPVRYAVRASNRAAGILRNPWLQGGRYPRRLL